MPEAFLGHGHGLKTVMREGKDVNIRRFLRPVFTDGAFHKITGEQEAMVSPGDDEIQGIMVEGADQVIPEHGTDAKNIQRAGGKVISVDQVTVDAGGEGCQFGIQFRGGTVDDGVLPAIELHQGVHVIAVIVMPVGDKIQVHMVDADSFQIIKERIVMNMLRDGEGAVGSAVNEDGVVPDGEEIGISAADINLVQAKECTVRGRRRNSSVRGLFGGSRQDSRCQDKNQDPGNQFVKQAHGFQFSFNSEFPHRAGFFILPSL